MTAQSDLQAALQAALTEVGGVDENGDGAKLAGYACAVVYLRPDGTSGLTVVAPYTEPEQVAGLLDAAHELVVQAGPVDVVPVDSRE